MWIYEKKLQYPVRIKKPDARMAKCVITQYGGPDGELAASLRYLSQRYHMPIPEAKAILNDIGTEGSQCATPFISQSHTPTLSAADLTTPQSGYHHTRPFCQANCYKSNPVSPCH